MATFKYKALTPDGAEMKGVMQAPDEYSAVQRIRQKCPVIQEITPVKESGSGGGLLSMELGSKEIDGKSLSVMCSQFAIMLRSGQMIGRVMQMVADQTADKSSRSSWSSAPRTWRRAALSLPPWNAMGRRCSR